MLRTEKSALDSLHKMCYKKKRKIFIVAVLFTIPKISCLEIKN